jgi:hypothetical protein
MLCSFGLLPNPRSEPRAEPNGLLKVTVTVRWIPLVPATYWHAGGTAGENDDASIWRRWLPTRPQGEVSPRSRPHRWQAAKAARQPFGFRLVTNALALRASAIRDRISGSVGKSNRGHGFQQHSSLNTASYGQYRKSKKQWYCNPNNDLGKVSPKSQAGLRIPQEAYSYPSTID